MKEIPILFSTVMVQALLEGRKTQTRRLVEEADLIAAPDHFRFIGDSNGRDFPRPAIKYDDRVWYEWQLNNSNHASWVERCRWKVGDLLWVRENWQLKGWDFEEGTMKVQFVTGETINCLAHDPSEDSEWLMNQVDKLENDGYIIATSSERFEFTAKKQPFKPSIHMPKEAARIWLQVTHVRVEQLQEISGDDVLAEGVGEKHRSGAKSMTTAGIDYRAWESNQKRKFQSLWEEINGADSWQANPWVWVVSFKVLSTTGKPDLNNL